VDIVALQLAKKYVDETMQGAGAIKGDPGATPYIGENGNWWISGTDMGVPASGKVVAHGQLEGRDAENQHPVESIYGLEEITNLKILQIWNGV